jgi:hypothetical protein
LNSLLQHSSLSIPLPIQRTFQQVSFFAFTCMYTFFYTIFTLPPSFPQTSPPLSLAPTLPPVQDLFCPPSLLFCRRQKKKKKNMTFLLACDKCSHTGSFLVVFPWIYVLTPNWFLSSNYLHSTSVLFYGGFSRFKISTFIFV